MESEVYVPVLTRPDLMTHFDVEMSYRLSSQVLTPYYSDAFMETWRQQPPLPLDKKINGVVHLARNCITPGHRELLIDTLHSSGIRVDYKGLCQFNNAWEAEEEEDRGSNAVPDKISLFRQYRFCICMENSLAMDYVSEKVYHGLMAGCLPIYWGRQMFEIFLPSPDAVIDASEYSTIAELVAEVKRLSENDTAYEERMAWRSKAVREWPPVLQEVRRRLLGGTSKCQLCQLVALPEVGDTARS
eukprot:jgi/Botrbrau1/5259/Bobra.0172s0118.1